MWWCSCSSNSSHQPKVPDGEEPDHPVRRLLGEQAVARKGAPRQLHGLVAVLAGEDRLLGGVREQDPLVVRLDLTPTRQERTELLLHARSQRGIEPRHRGPPASRSSGASGWPARRLVTTATGRSSARWAR